MIHPWDWAFFTISIVIGPGGSPASSVPSMSKLTNTANGAPSFGIVSRLICLQICGFRVTSPHPTRWLDCPRVCLPKSDIDGVYHYVHFCQLQLQQFGRLKTYGQMSFLKGLTLIVWPVSFELVVFES